MTPHAITLEQVTKRFGQLVAVHQASAQFARHTIHAVVGENGAGKSTLLGLAGGTHRPDSGQILIDGQPLGHFTPSEATQRGVGFVHQHFMLVEAFSALENIILGFEPTRSFGRLDLQKAQDLAQRTMKELQLELDLKAPVSELGVGERQSLEILRVLVHGAKTILLDEPTAVLTPGQAEKLFGILRRMAENGSSIVVVTHRLTEVMNYCDAVTVMRRGRVISTKSVADTSALELTRAIMGAEPPPPISRPQVAKDAPAALSIESLCVAGVRSGRLAVDHLSLKVAAGHIVGIAGVEGNGQQELVQALSGLQRPQSGTVHLGDKDITELSTAARRAEGLTVVHPDRHHEGLMLEASVGDNLVLGDLGQIDERGAITQRIQRFGIVPPQAALCTRNLSGGNQQKIVIARALDRRLKAVVLAQPTRGVDLGAARAIHEAIVAAAKSGAGVLVLSADLAELRAICHQVLVLARGKIVATLSPDSPEEVFGRAMLGLQSSGAQA